MRPGLSQSTSLRQELKAGAEADEAEFVALDADEIIVDAKKSRKTHGR